MSEDERLVERGAETGGGRAGAEPAAGSERGGLRGRLPTFRVFSVRGFALALAFALAGVVAGSLVPFVGVAGRFVGLFLAAFAVGVVRPHRAYLEVALAGALAATLGFLLSALGTVIVPVVADYGAEIAGVGAATGLLVSVVGHYFGRDLRAGLVADL